MHFAPAGGREMQWRRPILLGLLGAGLVLGQGLLARRGPALADEYIYLAGARFFAQSGGLDARFYDTEAILRQGYPHHDVHAPGYVIALGILSRLLGDGYSTAVLLNAVAYLLSALLVMSLALRLGHGEGPAYLAGALYLVLPVYLAYTYWAMAEVLLGALFLLALVLALALGERAWGAAATGVVWGAALLVRESAIFGLPAVFVVTRRRLSFLAGAAFFVLLVYLPLSIDRAPGGANFWNPTSGRAFGFEAVQATLHGDLPRAAGFVWHRAAQNAMELLGSSMTWTERGVLILYLTLPAGALARWKSLSRLERQFLAALTGGWVAMVFVLFSVYVIGQWSGLRYMMFLMPAFLPWIARWRWVPWAIGLAGLLLCGGILSVFNGYKTSRQARQEALTATVERYLDPGFTRIVLPEGWLFGLRHYPVEVISSPPRTAAELRALEGKVSFEYLVLRGDEPEDAALGPRYRRLNPARSSPRIYRHLP